MTKLSIALLQVLGAGFAAAVVTLPASAQQAQQAEPAAKERIEVTGSNIKRVDAESSQPVLVMTRDDIERTGASSVEQLLSTIGAATNFNSITVASGSGASTGGISTVSLRGLGGTRTLVLLNGKRIAAYGSLGDSVSVDVNSIPIAAIERIEVLKDGASAVYGSDAVGGVINFITRKDFKGVEATVEYGEPTRSGGGSTTRVIGVAGMGDPSRDKYNVMVVGNYQKDDSLFGRDRAFAATGVNVSAGNDGTSGNTFPGNITFPVGTTSITGANLAGATRNPNSVSNGGNCAPSISDPLNNPLTRCRFDPSPFVTLLPDAKRGGLYATGRFIFGSGVEAYGEASYQKSEQRYVIQPVPLSDQFALPANNPLANQSPYNGVVPGWNFSGVLGGAPNDAIIVYPTSQYYPTSYIRSLIGATATLPAIAVRYRNFATGLRDLTDTAETPRVVAGLQGTAGGWDWDAYYLYSSSKLTEHVNGGYPLLSRVLPLLNSGTVNLWGPNTDATNQLLQATNFIGDAYINKTSINEVNGKGSRELMNMAGGPLAMAVGVDFRQEKYESSPDPTIQTGDVSGYGGNFLPVDVSRHVWAIYGELDAPVSKTVELNAALRYDDYENTGSKTTGKLGVKWQPAKEVLLRASYGTGFRAPSLTDLYAPQTQGVSGNATDPLRCPITGSSIDCNTQFPTLNGGNAQLKPEDSKNLNVGFVIEPNNYFSVGVDAFDIKLTNTIIYGIDATTILGDLGQFGNLVTRGPGSGSLPGPITSINQTNLNLGETKIRGFDLDARARIPTQYGKFGVGINGTYFTKYDQQNLDGSFTGLAGQVGAQVGGAVIPRWKHYATMDWSTGPWDVLLAQTFQQGYQDLPGNITGAPRHVGTYELYDILGSYTGWKNWKLQLGVRNIFDRDPPYTNAPAYLNSFQSGYDPTYADPRGRFVYGRVTFSYK